MVHVEFIGINGAGKSTLYHQCNAYLAERLGYKPGPDKLWLRLIDDEALQPAQVRDSWAFRLLRTFDPGDRIMRRLPAPSANNYEFLAKAALHKGELLQKFLQLHANDINDTRSPGGHEHWFLQYFLTLLTCYQTRLEDPNRDVLLLDEGFVSVFSYYLVNTTGLDEELFNALLEKNFTIRYLFRIRADVQTCLDRLEVRGIPTPYAHLSRREFGAELAKRDADIERVCARLAMTPTKVVVIENDTLALNAFDLLKPHLDAIAKQADAKEVT